MDSSIWDKALNLLKYDDNINLVTYDSILCKMSVAHSDSDVLVLAARDEYSLNLVKGQKLNKIIENAIKASNDGKSIAVKFILAGDENALNTSVNSEKKL